MALVGQLPSAASHWFTSSASSGCRRIKAVVSPTWKMVGAMLEQDAHRMQLF